MTSSVPTKVGGFPDNEPDFNPMCSRCKCCMQIRQECENCGGIGTVWKEPEEFDDVEIQVVCDWCDGNGGWFTCDCDKSGKHIPIPPTAKAVGILGKTL